MQQTRKPTFFKTLIGAKRREVVSPKKAVQPLDARQIALVSGGTEFESPRGGWL